MVYKPTFGLLLVAATLAASPAESNMGVGAEVAVATTAVTGTSSGTTSSVSASGRTAVRAYFDMPYWQVALTYSLTTIGTATSSGTSDIHHFVLSLTDLGLGGMLKLPFSLGPLTIYPFVGLDYLFNVAFVDDKGNNLATTVPLDGLARRGGPWISGGLGADVMTYDIFHFRVEAAFCFNPLQTSDPLEAVDGLGTIGLVAPKQGVLIRVFSSWALR